MDYHFEIDLNFSQIVTAENEKEAVKKLEETFYEDYGIDLKENEFKLIKQ